MVDIDLLATSLRRMGHRVDDVTPVPENAGEYELTVDGVVLAMAQAEELLGEEIERAEKR